MATYEYICLACEHPFEERRPMTAGPVDTVLAMGELSAEFDARQKRARAELDAHHESYLGNEAKAHLERLVAPLSQSAAGGS